jgi:hypothetical protein
MSLPEREYYEGHTDDELAERRVYLQGTIVRLVEERNLVAEIHRNRVLGRELEKLKAKEASL